MHRRRMSLAETFARIDAIEPADVKRVAEKVIWDQEVAFAAVGANLKYIGDLNSLRRGTYWNRHPPSLRARPRAPRRDRGSCCATSRAHGDVHISTPVPHGGPRLGRY